MYLSCSPLATQSPVFFLTLSLLLFCSLPSAPLGGQDPPILSGCACLLCSCTCQNQPTWPVLNKYYQPWEGGSGSILKRPRGGESTNVPTNQRGVKTAASKPRIPPLKPTQQALKGEIAPLGDDVSDTIHNKYTAKAAVGNNDLFIVWQWFISEPSAWEVQGKRSCWITEANLSVGYKKKH